MILDVMDHAPYALKAKYPAAMVPFAFTLFFLHETGRLLCAQAEIERIIRESSLPERRKNELLGEMDLLLSFLDYNRIDAMSQRHRRALERLQGPATLINIKSTWTFGSPSVLYLFWRESGRLVEELAQMDACMPVYYRLTQGHGAGAEHIMRAAFTFAACSCSPASQSCGGMKACCKTQRRASQSGPGKTPRIFAAARRTYAWGSSRRSPATTPLLRPGSARERSRSGALS